ncbi:fructosamine-3-kinase-like [Gastrophryne carolinensis]
MLITPEMSILNGEAGGYQEVEDKLKKILRTSELQTCGDVRGGCISQARMFTTDHGKVFVKINNGAQAKTMFNGEVASLKEIQRTSTIRVPEPIMVTELSTGGALFIIKHMEMRQISKYAGKLGEQLAALHLHNQVLQEKMKKKTKIVGKCPTDLQPVEKFGFHTTTCCGYIPQVNEWQEDWVTFFASQRLEPQLNLIERDYGDREILQLWSELQVKVHYAFKDMMIVPSLLHGDFWEANVAEDDVGPLLFDPGSFYGHSEYDLSIGEMFGAHWKDFCSSYHWKIPKAPGFEIRQKLYQLFHSLNNWNHFGLMFRGVTVGLMRCLLHNL